MKKQLLCAALCATMVLASSLPAFAAKTLEEPSKESSSDTNSFQIPLAPLRFVDKEGNPVLGLGVSSPFSYIFSDTDGLQDLELANATGFTIYQGEKIDLSKPIAFSAYNPITGEEIKYNAVLHDKYETRLVWDKETPTQSIAKKKEKVEFRVVDQNGKPVKNAQFVLPSQQFLIPTNEDGKTWYYGEPFKMYRVELHYQNSKGEDQAIFRTVTIEKHHLEHGKMHITFKVTV